MKTKKRLVSMVMVFTLVLSLMYSVMASSRISLAKNPWGGDDMDDWPLAISCDPDFPLFGPEVGETKEETISALQDGNTMLSLKVKNYSKDIVKISKIKKNTSYGGNFSVTGLKKGYAHIKVIVKIKIAQNGKTKYVWNIKKYPVGHNED